MVEHLKNTIVKVMEGLSAKNNPGLDADPEAWLKKTLTKKELGHIKVKYFTKGILGLSVDSSVWLYALSLKKEDMIVKLKKYCPGLKNVILRIGEV